MTGLTEQQLKTFSFVDRFIQENHVAPTTREISAGCGWKSEGSARQHLGHLERLGYIARDRGRGARLARFLRILKRPEEKTSTKQRAAA